MMKALVAVSFLSLLPLHAAEQAPKTTSGNVVKVATIGGQVRRPGPVNWRKGLTIYAAIQEAGGETEFGSLRRVKVIRDGKSTVLNLTDDKVKMMLVEADDTIEVPQKNLFGR